MFVLFHHFVFLLREYLLLICWLLFASICISHLALKSFFKNLFLHSVGLFLIFFLSSFLLFHYSCWKADWQNEYLVFPWDMRGKGMGVRLANQQCLPQAWITEGTSLSWIKWKMIDLLMTVEWTASAILYLIPGR